MKTAAIFGPACPTPADVLSLRGKVMSLLLHGNWQIMVRDAYGLEAEALRICRQLGRKVVVVGTNVRPSNGAPSGCYVRAFGSNSYQDRRWVSHAYMIAQADLVICIGDTDIGKAVPYSKRSGAGRLTRVSGIT